MKPKLTHQTLCLPKKHKSGQAKKYQNWPKLQPFHPRLPTRIERLLILIAEIELRHATTAIGVTAELIAVPTVSVVQPAEACSVVAA